MTAATRTAHHVGNRGSSPSASSVEAAALCRNLAGTSESRILETQMLKQRLSTEGLAFPPMVLKVRAPTAYWYSGPTTFSPQSKERLTGIATYPSWPHRWGRAQEMLPCCLKKVLPSARRLPVRSSSAPPRGQHPSRSPTQPSSRTSNHGIARPPCGIASELRVPTSGAHSVGQLVSRE